MPLLRGESQVVSAQLRGALRARERMSSGVRQSVEHSRPLLCSSVREREGCTKPSAPHHPGQSGCPISDLSRDNYDAVYFTNLTLLSGRVRVSRGGNPEVVLGETLKERETLARRVARIVERLRTDWQDRMSSVDVHAFRMTHRSWAEASGVPPVLIDKQLGHSSGRAEGSLDVLRAVAGSATGRKHYLDMGSPLFDASRSAQAVRELFDRALEAARKQVDTVLAVPISVPMALNATN